MVVYDLQQPVRRTSKAISSLQPPSLGEVIRARPSLEKQEAAAYLASARARRSALLSASQAEKEGGLRTRLALAELRFVCFAMTKIIPGRECLGISVTCM